MDTIHSEEYKGFTIKIHPDENADSPRSDDHLGRMICFHRRYTLGDPHAYKASDYSGWDDNEESIRRDLDGKIVIPLYLYDHGGITISTKPFSCPWDSGRVGTLYATEDDIVKWFGAKEFTPDLIDKAIEVLEAEVALYDQWLRGDVYGYTLASECHAAEDSCWGYYGQESAIESAKEQIDYILADKFRRRMKESLKLTGMEE